MNEICAFVSDRLDFIYIPAVRTAEHAMEEVRTRFRKSLEALYEDPQYQSALSAINEMQRPLLEGLAAEVRDQMSRFITTITDVQIDTLERRIHNSVTSNIEMLINDGVSTPLELKGDGIKSLVALSLFNSTTPESKSRVVAIEEPESHLHSGAVHELRSVLARLAKEGQVIISTHNPSFVDRQKLADVVLIERGKAQRVKDISLIRSSLGILVSDNLVNAEFSIICEGESDVKLLSAILSVFSSRIRSAITARSVVFDNLGGSGKLTHKILILDRDVFDVYCIMDNDQAGRSAIESAKSKSLLTDTDYTTLAFRGAGEAELEDGINISGMRQDFLDRYGVDINSKNFKGNLKFSERMKRGFELSGKIWSESLSEEVKSAVISYAIEKLSERMNANARELIEVIALSIERKLRRN